jgi:hypothetical protein
MAHTIETLEKIYEEIIAQSEGKPGVDPQFIAVLKEFKTLPMEAKLQAVEQMNASTKINEVAYQNLHDGFPCDCGGVMYYAMQRQCRYNAEKNCMYDSYDLKCEKCGKMDVYAVDLPHMQVQADDCKAQGRPHKYAVSGGKYSLPPGRKRF